MIIRNPTFMGTTGVATNVRIRFFVYFNAAGGNVITVQDETSSSNDWIHIVAVRQPPFSRLYFNAVKVDEKSNAQTKVLTTAPVYIGRFFNAGTANNLWYNGLLEQATYFNDYLSDAEILSLYNSGNGLPYSSFGSLQAKTVSCWEFNGNTNDSAGFLNGIAENSPSYIGGLMGQAIQMQTTLQQSVFIGDNSAYESQNFTLSIWIKPSFPFIQAGLITKYNSAGQREWYLDCVPL